MFTSLSVSSEFATWKKTRPHVISVDDDEMVNLVVDHVMRFGSIMRATATLNVLLMQNGCDPVSPKVVKSLLEQLGGLHLAIPKLPQGNSNPKSKWARARWGFSIQILLCASEDAFGSAEEANEFFDREIPRYLTVKYNHDNNGKQEKPFVLAHDGSIDWKNRANWPLCFQSDLLTPLKWGSVCFFDEKHTQQSMGRKGLVADKEWVLPHGADGNIDTANGAYTPTRHERKFKYRQESRFVAGCVKHADTDTTIKTRVSPPFIYTGKFE